MKLDEARTRARRRVNDVRVSGVFLRVDESVGGETVSLSDVITGWIPPTGETLTLIGAERCGDAEYEYYHLSTGGEEMYLLATLGTHISEMRPIPVERIPEYILGGNEGAQR